MDRGGIRSLKMRVRRECSISRGRARLYRSEEEVTVLQAGLQQGGSSRSESCQEF